MLAQAELFFDKQQFTLNVVDVCVAAGANALEINLHIYQKLGKKAGYNPATFSFQEDNQRNIPLIHTCP